VTAADGRITLAGLGAGAHTVTVRPAGR
jgi:hypothetical protein